MELQLSIDAGMGERAERMGRNKLATRSLDPRFVAWKVMGRRGASQWVTPQACSEARRAEEVESFGIESTSPSIRTVDFLNLRPSYMTYLSSET